MVGRVSAGSGRFRIRNRRDFVDLSDLRGEWELTDDGAVVGRGKLPPLRVPPGGALDVRLDVERRAASKARGERFVTFRFFLRRPTEWAPAGHEVAWQQLELPSGQARPASRATRTLPTEANGTIVLEAGGTRAVVDRDTGTLAELGRGRRAERPSHRSGSAALAGGDRQRRAPAATRTE